MDKFMSTTKVCFKMTTMKLLSNIFKRLNYKQYQGTIVQFTVVKLCMEFIVSVLLRCSITPLIPPPPAVDNINHNPGVKNARTFFHGTSSSVFQHPDSLPLTGCRKGEFNAQKSKSKRSLPDNYTNIKPAYCYICFCYPSSSFQ